MHQCYARTERKKRLSYALTAYALTSNFRKHIKTKQQRKNNAK